MILQRARSSRFRDLLLWAMAALLLAMSTIGAIASTHGSGEHADNTFAVDARRSVGDECGDREAPSPLGSAGTVVHDLVHAWHHCGVVMAVLAVPVVKLLPLPLLRLPDAATPATPAPTIQGLFRPPIR